jgi:nicotinate-nucleotide pyrophosphorylase (carboxylating)
MPAAEFEQLLEMAIAEDLGAEGDVTSLAIFGQETGEAFIITRQDARLAGLEYACRVFRRIDPELDCRLFSRDGQDAPAGAELMSIRGPVVSMLRGERIALNFMAYLSGIATQTREHVRIAASAGRTVVLDTRKTLPGWRHLAKEAVVLGGGTNHRMGLYDMVMIKDNHIDASGGIAAAVERVRARWGTHFRIEVEARGLADVEAALGLDVDVIMLDNMDEAAAAAAVRLRRERWPDSTAKFEASGDMNPEKLKRFAGLGLDYISVGRLTHSVAAVNFSMQFRKEA